MGMKTICEDYRNDGLGHLEQAGRLITLNLLYPIENQPFATSREALSGLIETLGVRPKIDILRTDLTREVIHIGLSGTVGVI